MMEQKKFFVGMLLGTAIITSLRKKRNYISPVIYTTNAKLNNYNYEYPFTCTSCHKKIKIRSNAGRYGKLGVIECPYCHHEYFMKDDEGRGNAYIYEMDDYPDSYLDCRKHKHTHVHSTI